MSIIKEWCIERGYHSISDAKRALKDLGVRVKRYDREGVYVLNYIGLSKNKDHPVIMASRGTILKNDFEPVCIPFTRFFNYGEVEAIDDKFDWDSCEAQMKVDGSLVKVYHYNGEWQIATRGTAFAEGDNDEGFNFKTLIIGAFMEKLHDEVTDNDREAVQEAMEERYDKGCTYLFEVCSPENKIVTPYESPRVYFLGKVRAATGEEEPPTEDIHILPGVRDISLLDEGELSFIDVKDKVNKLDGLQEGVVMIDKYHTRMKIKSIEYLAIHRMKTAKANGGFRKSAIKAEINGDGDTFIEKFPEASVIIERWREYTNSFLQEADLIHEEARDIPLGKELAEMYGGYYYRSLLFVAKRRGCKPSEAYPTIDSSKKEEMVKRYLKTQKEEIAKKTSDVERKKRAIISVGIPCSGKSTDAQKWLSEDPDNRRIVDRDEYRRDMFDIQHLYKYKSSRAKENSISEKITENLREWARKGYDVYICNTNLNTKHRESLTAELKSLQYEIEIKTFEINFFEAWRRNEKRLIGEGKYITRASMYSMYTKMERFMGKETYIPQDDKPKAIMVDLDGTIASHVTPNGTVIRSPYDLSDVTKDLPVNSVISIVNMMAQTHTVLILSGREEICKGDTVKWLQDNKVSYDDIYMRPKGDRRRDYIVKREMFDKFKDSFSISAVFDDRHSVCQMWYDIGLPLFKCGSPSDEF